MHAITKLRRIVCFAFHTGVSLLYTFPKNIEMPILAQKFDFGDFGTFLPDFFEFLKYDFPENFTYNLPQCGTQW